MAATLTDKVALVIGGSRGISSAIAKRLAEPASVALTYAGSQQKAQEVACSIEAREERSPAPYYTL